LVAKSSDYRPFKARLLANGTANLTPIIEITAQYRGFALFFQALFRQGNRREFA
jgi:hypothetical protein